MDVATHIFTVIDRDSDRTVVWDPRKGDLWSVISEWIPSWWPELLKDEEYLYCHKLMNALRSGIPHQEFTDSLRITLVASPADVATIQA